MLIMLSLTLFAKDIYLVDTPKCKVYFSENDNTQFYEKGLCRFKNTDIMIDNLRYIFQLSSKNDIYRYLKSSHPIKQKNKQQIVYELNHNDIAKFTTMPKYNTVYVRDKKYMFVTYRYEDLVVLMPFDDEVYKKRKKLLCDIPRYVKVKKIADDVTIQTLLVESILEYNGYKKSDKFIQKLLYKKMDYKEIVDTVLNNLPKDKAEMVLVNLFDGYKLLKFLSFDEKLKFFQTMKDEGVKNRYQVFTLYRVLSNGYMWSDATKELKLQMQNIDFLKKHYARYKELIIDNDDDLNHLQPDIYAEVMILAFKEKIKDKKLLDSYTKKMREFEKFFQKDITNHSMQTLLTTLSDERIDKIDKNIAIRLKDEFNKKVKADKKEIFTLVITNYKVQTYIYIKIKLQAKDTPKILNALLKNERFREMNSKYSLEFKKGMSKEQIVKKVVKKYGLDIDKLKILKVDITVENVKK